MPYDKIKPKFLWILTPVFGIILFIILYIVAAIFYPGGSQADKNAVGFSWINNYWCNLLNEKAMNGQLNPARPVALIGTMVLCFSLAFFWYIFSRCMDLKKQARVVIFFSGVTSMLFALFLFTTFHDVVINIAGACGLVALLGTLNGLYKNRWYFLLVYGLINLLLVALNNYVYYTKGLLLYLPVIQKISFVSFLLWVSLIDFMLYQKVKFSSAQTDM